MKERPQRWELTKGAQQLIDGMWYKQVLETTDSFFYKLVWLMFFGSL